MDPLTSTRPYSDPRAVGSSGNLQLQLSEVERQLSDCVNCDSSKSLEGKARIQRLEARAQALKARLESLAIASRPQAQGPLPSSAAEPEGESRAALLAALPPSAPYASDGGQTYRPGSHLDLSL